MYIRRLVTTFLTLPLCVNAVISNRAAAEGNETRPEAVPIGAQVPGMGEKASWEVAKDLNVNLVHTLWAWKELEPESGNYIWLQSDRDARREYLERLDAEGYTISIGDSTVHMDHKHLPTFFEGKRFNDPELLVAWERFLVAFLKQYGDYLDQFMIGNEVMSYFGGRPEEWRDYVEFFKRGSDVIRRERPGLPMGIILTTGERNRAAWEAVAPYCDFLAVNYYTPCSVFAHNPTKNALDPDHPKYFAKTLEQAMEWAGRKPVFIAEIGCATGEIIDSSPELQAKFVRAFFQWLREHETRVTGVSWLSIQDWPYQGTKQALQGYLAKELLEHEKFMAYLTTLGLKYEDGRPKPGYHAFKEEIQRYRLPEDTDSNR